MAAGDSYDIYHVSMTPRAVEPCKNILMNMYNKLVSAVNKWYGRFSLDVKYERAKAGLVAIVVTANNMTKDYTSWFFNLKYIPFL